VLRIPQLTILLYAHLNRFRITGTNENVISSSNNIILRIKEQETFITLQEHDDDDVDELIRSAFKPVSLERMRIYRRHQICSSVQRRTFLQLASA